MNERPGDHNKKTKWPGNKNSPYLNLLWPYLWIANAFHHVVSSGDQSHGNMFFKVNIRMSSKHSSQKHIKDSKGWDRTHVRYRPFHLQIYERIFIYLTKQRSFWYIYTLKAAWLLFAVDVWQNGGDECDLFEIRFHPACFIWGDVGVPFRVPSAKMDEKITDKREIKINKY